MNFNLSELEKLFEEIKEIINFIEISQHQNKRHRLYLGNGDKLNFYTPNNAVPHLLGVDTNYLMSTGNFSNTSSFEVLKEMCENPYRINQLYKSGIIDYKHVFSPFIKQKIEIFKENIKINIEETILMCKYDSSRAFITDDKAEKYDYIIIRKYSNGKIGVLGLGKRKDYYVPMSNQLFNSFDDARDFLERYLKNQEVTILRSDNIFNTETDYDKTVFLNFEKKLKKIKEIRKYKDLFNCSLDLSGDYEFSIGKLKENRTNQFEDNDLIDIIVKSIKEGKLIDTKIFRDTNLSKIIEAFNDYLCVTQIDQNSEISQTYSSIKHDLEVLRSELANLKIENNQLKTDNSNLSEKVALLESENTEYEETQQKIYELVNRKPRMQ